ncbi:uncharacterized protein LOC143905517 isoform X1 [Temnothorax americanus]|uniref:uncharacterized protein LOC143905517 isoform X1 n=2 Tax=Temnothorax americanus TaxID=1964332 RepID=UPI0040696FE0
MSINIKYLAVCKMSTEDNEKNPSTSHPGPNVEDPKLQEYYTDEEIESLLIENLYLKSQLKRLHPKMSTDDNQKNPSTSHSGPNVEDPKLQEYYADEETEGLLVENLYLKSKLKRLHLILKMFSHNPKVAEYLQQHNVK